MKKRSQKSAFSLLELSIVILTIGIIIVGISRGSQAIKVATLNSAKAATANSPARTIDGLALWMETVMDESFATQMSSGDLVSNWRDINPQNFNKYNTTQSTNVNKPAYLTNCINYLPCIGFYGTPSGVTDNNFDYLSIGTAALSESGALSVIIVSSLNTLPSNAHYFIGHQSGWARWRISNTGIQSNKGIVLSQASWNTNYPSIYSVIVDNTSATFFLNGTQTNSGSLTAGAFTQDNAILIGGTEITTFGAYSLNGLVGEIIVFNRTLSNEERQAVEKYLSAKWKIKLSY